MFIAASALSPLYDTSRAIDVNPVSCSKIVSWEFGELRSWIIEAIRKYFDTPNIASKTQLVVSG